LQFDPCALAHDRWRAVSALDRMGKLARLEHQALRRAECSSEITAAREARDRAAARQEEAACLALATLRSCTQPLDKDLALAMHLSNIEEEERRSVLWRQLPDDVIEHVLKLMDLKRRHQLVIKACKEGIEFQLERQVRASRSGSAIERYLLDIGDVEIGAGLTYVGASRAKEPPVYAVANSEQS